MKVLAGLLLLIVPAVATAQGDSAAAARIRLTGAGGARLGSVTLGVSHRSDVRQVLDSLGGLGPERENDVTFIVGADTMRPRRFYTPPATMNQLYFEDDVLVMVVEGIPQDLPLTRSAFAARYPDARETHREAGWYELQIQVGGCVWLMAVFGAGDNQLQSDGYAYTCKRRP